MLYNLLTDAADKTRTVPIDEVTLLAVLGFAIVFIGIAFLIFVVWAVGQIMKKLDGLSPAPKQAEAPVQASVAQGSGDEVDEETVAVIMAALMAYYQQTNAKCDFTVKRIKRI